MGCSKSCRTRWSREEQWLVREQVKRTVGVPNDGRWKLPADWMWSKASDFSRVVGGSTPRNASDNSNYNSEGIPWITPADLSGYAKATIGIGRRSLAKHVVNRNALVPTGSVLISSRAPVGYCAVAANPLTTNQGFRSLILNESINPFFIRYYVIYSKEYLQANASGTTFKEISGSVLGDLLFPLAPIDIQERVVARVDELFAELDDAEAALSRARSDLATWRKALLKAAVTGELTADWRADNPPTETGAELLARILADRRARWLADPRNRGKRYIEPEEPDTTILPILPTSWVWANLEAFLVGGIQNGLYMSQSAYGTGAPIIRIDDFQPAKARPSAALRRVTVSSTIHDIYSLNEGDCVINRVNSLSHLAKSFMVRKQHLPALFESNMMRAKPSTMMVLDYLETYLASDIGRSRLCRNAKAAVNQASINQTDVNLTPVPLPPICEQIAIVEMISRQLNPANDDDLMSLEKAGSILRQSILAAAFRGELVA